MNDTQTRKYSFFPKTLSQCIEPVTRPMLKAQGLAGSRILTEWESIAGASLASRCIPEKLSFPRGKTTGGTLTIAVENGFATELQHMQHIMLERLATYFGYQAVTRIVISQAYIPPAPAPQKTKKPSPPCHLPADIADGVEDEELKAALLSFAYTLSNKS